MKSGMEFFVGIENNGNSTCLSVEGKKDPCSSLLTLSQKFNESSTIYVTGGEDWKNKAVPIFGTALFNFSVKIMPVIIEGSVEYAAFKPVCRTYIRSMISFNMENISIDLSDFHQPNPPDVFVDHFICCREEVALKNCNISGGEFVISLYSSVLVIYPVSSFVWFDNVSFCNFYMQYVMKPEWEGSAVHISVNTIPPQAFVPSEPQKNLSFSSIFFSLSSHAQITPRTHSQRNREEISFQNCLFRFMRSSSYGGCLHINAQKQNQDKYYHIEFCECHFEMSTSRRGGSFIYASLFDINQLSFPYTPPPKRNKSEDVWIGERLVSFNPAPFCYFGVGNLVNQLITPGKAFPVPDMIERQPVLLVTDSHNVLFGQHLLIDLDRDINFPFVPYSHSIKGLIDNPHTDHNRISFRYNTGTIDANGDPMYIKHSLARFVTFSRMWITDSEKLDFLRFIGVPLEPQSLDDHDNIEKCRAYFDADEESRDNTMSAQDCCGTAQMSCERLGFTIDNTGNGQYDCTKRCAVAEDAYVFTCICDPLAELEDNANGNFYDLSSNSNTTLPSFYGKTVYLSFTDQSIPTPLAPNFIGDNLEGLNNLHISYTLNHIRGFDENGEPILYTFEDVLGKHPPAYPRLGCLLIDAGKDPDICVANEDTNGNKICTITSDGEGRAVCDYISLQMQSAGFVTAQLLRLEIGKRMNMNVMLLTVGMFALMAWCGKKEKDQMDR